MKKRVIKPFNLEKAKAGAEVCTRDGHKARIICFDAVSEDYPIISLITNGNGEDDDYWHMNNGRRFKANVNDFDLMLVEYEEETPTFEPFQKVLVRHDDDNVWRCDLFSHYDKFFICVGGIWNQCIPFEGNEHLVGTTNNPE